MAKPKYDYDGDTFYRRIQESADRQMLENHIVWDKVLAEDLGFEAPTTFSEMKNGEYRPWSKEENERRSKRINELLSRVLGGSHLREGVSHQGDSILRQAQVAGSGLRVHQRPDRHRDGWLP